jgi:eukaryotic-like serine/threonine-protein kinase
MVDRIGQQLGNYRLKRFLGEGGFAEVYVGEHIHLGTEAAIKVHHSQLTNEDVEQFRNEARTIARLKHPHIVRVFDFGVEGKTPFLVMDYAPHGNLRQRHPRGSVLPISSIVSYVKQITAALQYAHAQKLIHRDIKPENILLETEHEILLSDFGIALVAQSSRYQSTQDVVGTVAYMSPEQIQGKPRPASDQYSLGIVVYEWLCGERPFHGSFTEMCTQHMFAPPSLLHEKNPDISSDLEQVIMTALSKDPHQRFMSVQAFATALEQAAQEGSTTYVKPLSGPQSFQSLLPTIQVPSSPLPPIVPIPVSGQELAPTVLVTPPAKPPSQGTTLTIYHGHTANIESVAWSPDSMYIASGDGKGTVHVWNATTKILSFSIKHSNWMSTVVWSPDGKRLVTGSHDQTVKIWSADAGEHLLTYQEHKSPVSAVAWSPEGKYIASGSWDGVVRIWDVAVGTTIFTYRHVVPIRSATVHALQWSPDSKYIASAGDDNTVQLWDISTRKQLFIYRKHTDTIMDIAWTRDGTYIASTGYDQTVQVWHAINGNIYFMHQGHKRLIRAVTWSPDGIYLASAGSDNTTQIWNINSRTHIFTYQGHNAVIKSIAWSPDGTRIASSGDDKVVRVWQAIYFGK